MARKVYEQANAIASLILPRGISRTNRDTPSVRKATVAWCGRCGTMDYKDEDSRDSPQLTHPSPVTCPHVHTPVLSPPIRIFLFLFRLFYPPPLRT
ncbi:hypothetical protein VTJ04DRAFT_2494 [Mycothermus thermophilus]|uniref:uncharacterized protein n=1 Tax=Humicola insolens TaxID=85995 RepID=UPI00374295E7